MSGEKIEIGIIGVGQIGKQHLEQYLAMPDVRVTAIAGRDPGRTEEVARQYNIPFWTTDYRSLLDRNNVRAVSVCLHNSLHMPITVDALKAGKDVICEKPMAGSYADAAVMLKTAREEKRHLAIQLLDLFDKETRAAHEAMRQGWVGRPYLAHSSGFRRRGRPYVDGYGTPAFVQKEIACGGALFDMGVYHIAAIFYLLGNPGLLRISGRTFQAMEMDEARKAASGYNVEELAVGLVSLENNIVLTITEAWAIPLDKLDGSYIVGSSGGLRIKPFGLFRSLGDLDINAGADLAQFDFRLHNVREEGGVYDSPLKHFIAAIGGKVEPLPTAEVALNTMLLMEGIYLSQELGREIKADEIAAHPYSPRE